MAVIEINYEDREFLLDLEDMDTSQAAAMERFGVPNLKALEEGLSQGDVKSLTVYFWLCLQQNGDSGTRLEKVSFKPIKFLRALAKAKAVGADSEAEGKDAEAE